MSALPLPSLHAESPLPVVPAVAKWQPATGNTQVDHLSWTYDSAAIAPVITALQDDLPKARFTRSENPGAKGIHLSLTPTKTNPEAYTLEIKNNKALIVASGNAGLYHGTRTLLQLLNRGGILPMGRIEDAPKYKVRSVLLDVGRKFATVGEMKDWLRLMGWLKFNELHLHLNDNSWGRYPGYRLESSAFPGLASTDGHYSWKQIRELQDFAAARGIRILPEIDAPGHSLAFTTHNPRLAHPELDRDGFGLAYLDVGNPEAIEFMEKLLDEVVPHFDSKEIHIGTDEYRIGLIKDQKKREQAGENFRKWINHFAAHLDKKHDRKTRIWSGYEHLPGTTEPSKDIIIDMWETSDAKAKSASGYQFVNSSHFFTYIVPGAPYYGVNNTNIYNNWTPLVFANKKGAILDDGDPGLLGGKVHIWNDYGPTGYTWNEIARLSLPSMAAFSEKLWGTKGSADYKAFRTRAESVSEAAPRVKILTPAAIPATGDLVWQLEKEHEFIANTSLPVTAASSNLEWPWTASFTVTRKNDISGNEILLGSDLATLYLDLTHTSGKKDKQVTQRGVACVRANQAPGYEPITSHTPHALVFDCTVPMNQKVRLTFVGEEKKTSLYLDGKLVQSISKQMLCPLGMLGAQDLPRGFHGTLHKAVIKASAPASKTLGTWSPESFTGQSTRFSGALPEASGTVTFTYTGGGHGVNMTEVAILSGERVVHRFDQKAFAGARSRNNTYAIPESLATQKGLTLRAVITGDGGTDSHGSVIWSSAP